MATISEVEKERAQKFLDDYFKDLAEGTSCTVIFTTDGEHHRMLTSSHPLPDKYLEQWEEDSRRFDVDLRLKHEDLE